MGDIIKTMQLGGPVMIPLLILAFAGFVIFAERMLYLHKGQIKAVEFLTGIKSALKNKRLIEALTICNEAPGPVARIVKAVLLHCERTPDEMRQAALSAGLLEIPLLQRRIPSVALIAKLSPVIGLIGTVLAMLKCFQIMRQSGPYADITLFSGQIYNALISTAVGLMFFVIFWLFYNVLHGKMRAIIHDMEWASAELILFIAKGMPQNENIYLDSDDQAKNDKQ